jgi:hypothetical protein
MLESPICDDADALVIGAEAISEEIFKGQIIPRAVYRLAEEGGWPIFKIRNKLAARRRPMYAEIERREEAARTTTGEGSKRP